MGQPKQAQNAPIPEQLEAGHRFLRTTSGLMDLGMNWKNTFPEGVRTKSNLLPKKA